MSDKSDKEFGEMAQILRKMSQKLNQPPALPKEPAPPAPEPEEAELDPSPPPAKPATPTSPSPSSKRVVVTPRPPVPLQKSKAPAPPVKPAEKPPAEDEEDLDIEEFEFPQPEDDESASSSSLSKRKEEDELDLTSSPEKSAVGFKQKCPSCEAMVPIKDYDMIGCKVDCPRCNYRFIVEKPAKTAAPTPPAKLAPKIVRIVKPSMETASRKKTVWIGVGIAVAALLCILTGIGIGRWISSGSAATQQTPAQAAPAAAEEKKDVEKEGRSFLPKFD